MQMEMIEAAQHRAPRNAGSTREWHSADSLLVGMISRDDVA